MKKLFAYSALVLTASLLSGCVFAPVVPPRGILYNNQKAPLFGGATTGSKDGRASAYSVLFLVGWGDSSLKRAAENGGIKSIKNTDYQVLNVALVYQRYTTIVRGEEEAPVARLPRAKHLTALAILVAALAGCSPTAARVGIGPPPALLYRNVKGPMTANRDIARQRGGLPILDNPKLGRCRAYQIQLNIPTLEFTRALSVGWGDMSLEKALENGKIETFTHADYREVSILGIFTQIDVFAYGE